jgi:hypothetical protein
MVQELPDILTPISREEIIRALWEGWMYYFNSPPPNKECLWVIAAQWALETGWAKSMHNFNLGNVKSVPNDGYDFCYYECNEALKRDVAEKYQRLDPKHARITAYRNDGTCWIWFYPPHAGCRFRAFHTLQEGAVDQIKILANRFSRAWPAVLAGDPSEFVHVLKMTGYFTADETEYKRGVVSIFKTISALNVDYDSLPIITDDQRERINNLMLLNITPISEISFDKCND